MEPPYKNILNEIENLLSQKTVSNVPQIIAQAQALYEKAIDYHLEAHKLVIALQLFMIRWKLLNGLDEGVESLLMQIIKQSQNKEYLTLEADAWMLLCSLYQTLENAPKCIDYSNKAYKLYNNLGLNDKKCQSLTIMATMESKLGYYEQALEHFFMAYDCTDISANPQNTSKPMLFYNIVGILIMQKRYDLAAEELKKFEHYYYNKNFSSPLQKFWFYLTKIAYNNELKNFDKSLEFCQTAFATFEDSPKLSIFIPSIHYYYSEATAALNQFELSFDSVLKILDYAEKQNALEFYLRGYYVLAKIFMSSDSEKSRKHFWAHPSLSKFNGNLANLIEEIKHISKGLNIPVQQFLVYELFIDYYEQTKNYQEAFKYSQQLRNLESDVYNIQKNDLIFRLQEDFNTKQKEQEIQFQQKMLTKQKQINLNLERFAHTASHDMREPLRMISNFAQLLNNEQFPVNEKEKKEFLDYIVSSSQQLTKLIRDLLKYSTMCLNTEETKEISLKQILDIILLNLKDNISKKNAQIDIPTNLPKLHAQASLLIQLFQNIFHNAIKFVDTSKPVQVHFQIKQKGTELIYMIKDNGIGIEAQHLEEIFTPFSRLHSKKNYPGSGIGLASCKKVVQFYGGEIWVESILDQGSTFYFTLPQCNPSW